MATVHAIATAAPMVIHNVLSLPSSVPIDIHSVSEAIKVEVQKEVVNHESWSLEHGMEWWIALWTALLFIATVGLFIATYLLFREAGKSSGDAKVSANEAIRIAGENAKATQKMAEKTAELAISTSDLSKKTSELDNKKISDERTGVLRGVKTLITYSLTRLADAVSYHQSLQVGTYSKEEVIQSVVYMTDTVDEGRHIAKTLHEISNDMTTRIRLTDEEYLILVSYTSNYRICFENVEKRRIVLLEELQKDQKVLEDMQFAAFGMHQNMPNFSRLIVDKLKPVLDYFGTDEMRNSVVKLRKSLNLPES